MTKKISLQDIFDAAWQAFIVEDRPPAVGTGGECKYLTDDGRKCAVGLVLPEGHPAQERNCLFLGLVLDYPDLWAEDVLEISNASNDGKKQLYLFQGHLHDKLVYRGQWTKSKAEREAVYRQVASDYGLTVPGEKPV